MIEITAMAMTTINDRSSGKSSGGDQWRRWCWRCFTTVTLEFYDRALSRKLVSCVTGVAKKKSNFIILSENMYKMQIKKMSKFEFCFFVVVGFFCFFFISRYPAVRQIIWVKCQNMAQPQVSECGGGRKVLHEVTVKKKPKKPKRYKCIVWSSWKFYIVFCHKS